MKAARIVASGAISALGEGRKAVDPFALPGIRADDELASLGLRRPRVARSATRDVVSDPAEWLLLNALRQLSANLDRVTAGWRSRRLAFVIGTSSGGMWSQTQAFDALVRGEGDPELCRAAPYWGPLAALRREFPAAPMIHVLAACASSAMALGVGRELLHDGSADLVIAGGYDALTPFVAAGFEALGVTTAERPLPFSMRRDGLALGEGAALVALSRDAGPGPWLSGFAASADASHPTSPADSGEALTRAVSDALRDAQVAGNTFLVSAHATSTLANDRAEAVVIGGFGPRAEAVQAFKSRVGHTLGAGSVLELLSAIRCAELGRCPPLEAEPFEPELRDHGEAKVVVSRRVVKLASAFGGANAVLVAELDQPVDALAREPSEVWLTQCGTPQSSPRTDALIAHSSLDPIHVRRLDTLSALCCSAALDVIPEEMNEPRGERQRTGVVMGSVLGSMEHNAAYQARLTERGHGRADPRKFPATSPNLAPGMVSILFGLGGPCTSVGAGYAAPFEALLVALELLQGGHAEHMLVIVADHRGAAVDRLLECANAPPPAHGALAIRLSAQRQEGTTPSLLPLRADILARLSGNSGSSWPDPSQVGPGSPATAQPGWPTLSAWLKDQGLQGS
ncbi:MAG: beta-ketoacyl synthase chain length factor [Polyangiaceae bacterium]|nr:beta-ketoacyl synthase chain length factor [Polyangiaceae bacterium]